MRQNKASYAKRWRLKHPGSAYRANKRWRKKHPETRYAGKSRYYERNRANPRNVRNAGTKWTVLEIRLVTSHDRPCDRILSSQLGRSIVAIQQMRHKTTGA